MDPYPVAEFLKVVAVAVGALVLAPIVVYLAEARTMHERGHTFREEARDHLGVKHAT